MHFGADDTSRGTSDSHGGRDQSHVDELQQILHVGMSQVFEGVDEWDLVDFPNYFNCGDSAIWLGQQVIGRRLGIRTRSVSTFSSYDNTMLAADGPIVITGGGNFGGLYPHHQMLRLRLLEEMRSRPIVQMPQSVEFAAQEYAHELRRGIERHGAFTLLVRDGRSYERAVKELNCEVVLVPDAAFALGPLPRPDASLPVVAQMRMDDERGGSVAPSDWSTFDWLNAGPGDPRWNAHRLFRATLQFARFAEWRGSSSLRLAAANEFSRKSLRYAVRRLGQGEVLITDRLHGHIIAELLGVPHITVNDRFGKIRAFWESWSSATGVLVDSWEAAAEKLGQLQNDLGQPLRFPHAHARD